MKSITVFLMILLTAFNFQSVKAQEWAEMLKKDMVVLKDNQMSITEYSLLEFEEGTSLQLKLYAQAPMDGSLSRDFFVSAFTSLQTLIILPMFSEFGNVNAKALDELIGNPDYTIKFFMNKNGIQIETIDDTGTSRETFTWISYFGE